ncbi:MAG: SCP2 sterol-binding domain-containing protein [Pseudomonadota bacterium]
MKLPMPPLPTKLINNTVLKSLAAKSFASLPVIVRLLPQPPHFVQKFVVEKALNRALAEQIEMGEFDFLAGHCLHLCVKDMNLDFYLSYAQGQLILAPSDTPADVHFSGNSKELILLASRNEDPDSFFFQRRLVIEGDTELGLYIKNIIDSVDFDSWPGWLNSLMASMAELIEIESNKQLDSKQPIAAANTLG